MSPAEVARIVESDLKLNEHKLKWFGRPIGECLVAPLLKEGLHNSQPVVLGANVKR